MGGVSSVGVFCGVVCRFSFRGLGIVGKGRGRRGGGGGGGGRRGWGGGGGLERMGEEGAAGVEDIEGEEGRGEMGVFSWRVGKGRLCGRGEGEAEGPVTEG